LGTATNSLGDCVGPDHARGAGSILDHDGRGIAGFRKLLLKQARDEVANAGRRGRHDEPDGLGWIVLAERGPGNRGRKQRGDQSQCCTKARHLILPAVFVVDGTIARLRVGVTLRNAPGGNGVVARQDPFLLVTSRAFAILLS
jgi:hypothetical protein